jgi:hypothetical protein
VLPQLPLQLGNLGPQRFDHRPQLRHHRPKLRVLRGQLLIGRRTVGGHPSMVNRILLKINQPRRRRDQLLSVKAAIITSTDPHRRQWSRPGVRVVLQSPQWKII